MIKLGFCFLLFTNLGKMFTNFVNKHAAGSKKRLDFLPIIFLLSCIQMITPFL